MRILLALILCCSVCITAQANDTPLIIIDDNDKDYVSLTGQALIMEDAQHEFSFEQIQEPEEENLGDFIQMSGEIPHLDFTTSAYWVKFRVKSNHHRIKDYLLEVARPLTNVANLYIQRQNGVVIEYKNGDDIPFNKRNIKHRKLVFPVTIRPKEELVFYLQLASDGEVLTLPIRLWEPAAWNEKDYKEQYILGLYFGILFFVIIIYFFFFIALRDKSFLYYVLYVASLFMLQLSLDGLAYQYLWASFPTIGNHAVLFFACLSVLFLLKYGVTFLQLPERSKKLNKLFSVFIFLALICLLLTFFSGSIYAAVFPAINAISLISILSILVAIYIIRKKGHKVDAFFSLAFFSLITGAVIFILSNFNVLANNMFTEHALKYGSALEVIFLSLTMAGKYRDIQQEKEKAQDIALEKLEELNKLKDNVNIELEKQVKERTAEIQKQKEVVEEKNKEVADSINYAKRIQEAILPSKSALKAHLTDGFLLFKPKDIVSGDFYWLEAPSNSPKGGGQTPLPSGGAVDGLIYFAVADCTGHGVPGAMVSVVCSNSLSKALLEEGITEPGKLLDRTRELVIERFEKSEEEVKDGMDIALCKLEVRPRVAKSYSGGTNRKSEVTLLLEYAGANNPLWIINPNRSEWPENSLPFWEDSGGAEIKADKQPIGKYAGETHFTNHTIELQKGDTIYIFSDGYPDQFGGEQGKKFKTKAFKKLLLSIQDKSMEEQKPIIDEAFENWKGSLEQVDDVCVIGVRI